MHLLTNCSVTKESPTATNIDHMNFLPSTPLLQSCQSVNLWSHLSELNGINSMYHDQIWALESWQNGPSCSGQEIDGM